MDDNIIDVEVIDRISYKDKFYYKVKYHDNFYYTKCFDWQLDKNYITPKKIKCFQKSINVEDNELVQVGGNHLIHPYFQQNLIYPFRIIDIQKTNQGANEYKLTIRGKDNINYTVKVLKTPFDNFKINENYDFKFIGISIKGELKFIPKRAFFPIESILIKPELIKNTFYYYFNSNSEAAISLKKEYKNNENIYVFTYCNLLEASIYSFLDNYDFNKANEFINSLLTVEKWIITSGFLTTFNEENRKQVKIKAESAINRFSLIKEAVSVIESLNSENFIEDLIKDKENLSEEKIDLIFYILKYTPVIDNLLFIHVLFLLGQQNIFKKNENRRFIDVISKRKKQLRKKIYENAKIEMEANTKISYDKTLISQLLQLTYCEATIAKDLGLENDFKLTRTSFFKQCAYYIEGKIKSEFFKKAIYLANFGIHKGDDIVFNWTNKNFNNKTIIFFSSNYILESETTISSKDEITNALLNNIALKAKIVGKFETGFQLNYKGINGILLFKDINNSFKYKVGDTINTYVIRYEPFTNEFLGTTIKEASEYYLSQAKELIWENFWNYSDLMSKFKDMQYSNINVGDIIEGRIKGIEKFGAFIDLGFIDALLHKNEIKWRFTPDPTKVFQINSTLKVKVIKKDDNEKKIYVSTKQLTADPWIKINELEEGKFFKAMLYSETQHGFIIELENGIIAFLNRKFVYDDLQNSFKSIFFINNAIKVRIIKVDKKQKKVFVDSPELLVEINKINNESYTDNNSRAIPQHESLENEVNQFLRYISFEKLFIIENFAFNTNDISRKIELLEWVRLYTSLYPTRKKFLIEFYLFFFKALNMFYEKKGVYEIQKFFKSILLENNFSKTVLAFPQAQRFLKIIEILSLFGRIDNKSITTLYNFIIDNSNDDELFSKLSKLILSANLMYSLKQEENYLKLTQTQIYKYLQSGNLEMYYSYEDIEKEIFEEQQIKNMIKNGESDLVEFKSTLLFDVRKKKENKKLEKQVLKTIVAFLNTKGGTLLIGVQDSGEIYGLDDDFRIAPGSAPKPSDRFLLYLDNLINKHIGKEFNTKIKVKIQPIGDKEICKIDVEPSEEPVILKYDKNIEEFYIRNKAQSQKLQPSEMIKYLRVKE